VEEKYHQFLIADRSYKLFKTQPELRTPGYLYSWGGVCDPTKVGEEVSAIQEAEF
jgi:hypothetical protein